MKCPICDGEGGWYEPVLYYGYGGGPYEECIYCNGTGKVWFWKWFDYKYTVWKAERKEKR